MCTVRVYITYVYLLIIVHCVNMEGGGSVERLECLIRRGTICSAELMSQLSIRQIEKLWEVGGRLSNQSGLRSISNLVQKCRRILHFV